MIRPIRVGFSLVIAGAALLTVGLAGCSGPSRHHNGSEGDAPALRPVAMRGEAVFFSGILRAEATVSRGRPRQGADDSSGGSHPRGSSGGSGGGGRRHGGGAGGGMGRPSGGDSGDYGDEGQSRPVSQPRVSAPPLTLRLKLANLSDKPVNVLIHDVRSDLGDFAVRPERLAIEPGQTAEVDPMVSELGVVAGEIPVTIVLRITGQTESQVVLLKDVLAPADK